MLNQPTFDKLNHLKLYGRANGFRTQLETSDAQQLSFEQRFALLVDEQYTWRENRDLEHRLRNAKLKQKATLEDINYQHPRGLDRAHLRSLASSEWVRQKQNILLLGPQRTRYIDLLESRPFPRLAQLEAKRPVLLDVVALFQGCNSTSLINPLSEYPR